MDKLHEVNLSNEQLKTRQTLIDRARDPNNSQAWDEFTDYYKGFIRMVLMQLQAPLDDLEDLSQTILVKLWQNLSTVELGRDHAKFRTWLGTVIRNTVYTHCSQAASRKRRETNAAVANVANIANTADTAGGSGGMYSGHEGGGEAVYVVGEITTGG